MMMIRPISFQTHTLVQLIIVATMMMMKLMMNTLSEQVNGKRVNGELHGLGGILHGVGGTGGIIFQGMFGGG